MKIFPSAASWQTASKCWTDAPEVDIDMDLGGIGSGDNWKPLMGIGPHLTQNAKVKRILKAHA